MMKNTIYSFILFTILSIFFSCNDSEPEIDETNGGFTHYIGEEFGGGVIFYLWKDYDGNEHGFIVDLNDLSDSQVWSNVSELIGAAAQTNHGKKNSIAIVEQKGHIASAAALCLNSTNGGYRDWYLPSSYEFWEILSGRLYVDGDSNNFPLGLNFFTVQKALENIAGATPLIDEWNTNIKMPYWTSTEISRLGAQKVFLPNGVPNGSIWSLYKSNFAYVRAIRAF